MGAFFFALMLSLWTHGGLYFFAQSARDLGVGVIPGVMTLLILCQSGQSCSIVLLRELKVG
jgi:hypothetical protein